MTTLTDEQRALLERPASYEHGWRDAATDEAITAALRTIDAQREEIERLKEELPSWELRCRSIAALEAENARLKDRIENAWGIIANASGGEWSKESVRWRAAAERWRDEWLDALRKEGK